MDGRVEELNNRLNGKIGLGGGGAKSTTDLTAASYSRWGTGGVRSLEAGAKYGMVVMPSLSPSHGRR